MDATFYCTDSRDGAYICKRLDGSRAEIRRAAKQYAAGIGSSKLEIDFDEAFMSGPDSVETETYIRRGSRWYA